ncbi:MAG: DUF1444 family protein [Phycisphaerales bacterium]|nr:DUF1444 family protein [Phycisphaerae bacterium]MDG2477939.1 DUF1444 family protein [Phycisphaerales bacterium]
MSKMPREPEAFSEVVLHLLEKRFPGHDVELAGGMDLIIDGRHLALANLFRMVNCDPDNGFEIVNEFLHRITEGDAVAAAPLPLSLARARIMPRIQPDSLFEHLDREQVAHTPWVNGTSIVYVIDLPRMTVSITLEQIIRWGLSIDEVEVLARENLSKYTQSVEVRLVESEEGGRVAILSVQDGYDAARLLMESLHGRLAPKLHGDFYVAAPARDIFLAISQGPDGFLQRVQSRVDRDYQRLPYPITKDLFVVTQDGIAGTATAA